jgi:hypothetical protein
MGTFRVPGICALLSVLAVSLPAVAYNTAVTVNTALDTHAISPYIYGTNQVLQGADNYAAVRQGGNRLTGYNWENNASNAGTDWYNSSDNLMTSGMSNSQALIPAISISAFIDTCRKYNRFCLSTFQMAGFVSRDKNGTVTAGEAAPSSRWRYVFPVKPTAFAAAPDTTDSAVYMDELMNFLKVKYMSLPDGWLGGICLDNEPALWPSTHPLIHPAAPACVELLTKSIALATAIKNVDTRPFLFGPVTYGFGEMYDLQGASDWASVRGSYGWFVDYYLDRMRLASTSAGRRLLDVFDIHWYSEAKGNGERIVGASNPAARANAEARIQAPRSLWDPNYLEDSWIGQWYSSYLPLIPRMKTSISSCYPGTKISFSEYNYGGEAHISGGLAMADVLGIYGKYDVFFASYWQMEDVTAYTSAAFRLFRNYDGSNGTFGSQSVFAAASDSSRSSVYASVVSSTNAELHLVLLNKDYDSTMNATVTINSSSAYKSVRVWSFDSSSAAITERLPAPVISGNSFVGVVPRLTACHFVLIPATAVRSAAPPATADGFSCKTEYPYLSVSYSFPLNENGLISLYALNGRTFKQWEHVTGHGNLRFNAHARGTGAKCFIVVCKSASRQYICKALLTQ